MKTLAAFHYPYTLACGHEVETIIYLKEADVRLSHSIDTEPGKNATYEMTAELDHIEHRGITLLDMKRAVCMQCGADAIEVKL